MDARGGATSGRVVHLTMVDARWFDEPTRRTRIAAETRSRSGCVDESQKKIGIADYLVAWFGNALVGYAGMDRADFDETWKRDVIVDLSAVSLGAVTGVIA